MPEQNNDALWYDKYYHDIPTDLAPWNKFLLPELAAVLKPNHKLIELGCGQGQVLRHVAETKLLPRKNICGIDQSRAAIDFVQSQIPGGDFRVGDLHELNLQPASFNFCLLMETIEHLTEPVPVLKRINELLASDGVLYLSFPNFLHAPWLAARLLSEKLNKPNWLNLQPVDNIYTVFTVTRLLRDAGFQFEKAIGTMYGPPMPWWLLRRLETPAFTRSLNALGLWRLSFHPIMKFCKNSA